MLLFSAVLLTYCSVAQTSGMIKPHNDTTTHIIAGKTYLFIAQHDSTREYTLSVCRKDSDYTEQFWLDLAGGDCNGRVIQVGDYTLSGNTLTIDKYTWNKNTEDIRYEFSYFILTRQTYVFRKNGQLICTGYREAKQGDALWKSISDRLEKRYTEMETFSAEYIFGGSP